MLIQSVETESISDHSSTPSISLSKNFSNGNSVVMSGEERKTGVKRPLEEADEGES